MPIVDGPTDTARADTLFEATVEQGAYGGPRTTFTVPGPDELREQGVAQAERRSPAWQREAIDAALAEAMRSARERGTTLTANDVRPLLSADVHRPLIAARFLAAAKAGRLVRVGYERSTDPRTHGAVVAVWQVAP